ncbi:hypothetical protein BG004_000060 [Podila humilis]|nr:hypothetical protein BG004_000060 [Podila humilis]
MEYITWAAQDIVIDGKVTEHVSFKSFVIEFGVGDKEVAMMQYRLLLDSTKLNKSRRERLRDAFADFEKARMNQFCPEGVAFSARGLSAAAAKNGGGRKARKDSAVLEDKDNVPNSNSKNETTGHERRLKESVNHGSHVEDATGATSSYSNSQPQEQGHLQPHATLQDEVDEDEWKLEGDDTCLACRFQLYQNDCVQALQDDDLCISDIADAMAIIGVFAPFLQTQRMRAIFNKKILTLLVSPSLLPDPGINDAAVLKAVRQRINNKLEDASKELWGIDRKFRLLFENLLEFLPEKVDRSISEVTYTVNYVAPVLNCILKIDGKTNVE